MLLVCSACSTSSPLLTREDYSSSVRDLSLGHFAEAERSLPEGEAGTFITTMERTYLQLLQGHADLEPLLKYRGLADDRTRIVISRELESLFYMTTPEGYYASEHEVIWMHLLLSWGFSLRKEYEKARVEARKASQLLTATWSENGHFDDPALRIMLAALWTWSGSWGDAQVDLRAAADLDPALAWARELAGRDQPPRNFLFVLGGIGPEPAWDPGPGPVKNLGPRALRFVFQGRRTPLALQTPTHLGPLHTTPSSAAWYSRHVDRDNAIQDTIQSTRYAFNNTGEAALHGAKVGIAAAYWVTITTGAAVIGGAIIYNCTMAGCGPLALFGALLPVAAYEKGKRVYQETVSASEAQFQRETDPTYRYRFVRFLPEYAWVG